MKKINRAEIFKKMHRLVKAYGMSKSEALTKAWKMAKLEIIENELFILNMKDLNGGRNNIAAQNQLCEQNRKIDELSKKVIELKEAIYPRITGSHEEKLTSEQIDGIKWKINKIKNGDPYSPKGERERLEKMLAAGTVTITYENKLDLNAYNVAA